jgi:hypothetical protein
MMKTETADENWLLKPQDFQVINFANWINIGKKHFENIFMLLATKFPLLPCSIESVTDISTIESNKMVGTGFPLNMSIIINWYMTNLSRTWGIMEYWCWNWATWSFVWADADTNLIPPANKFSEAEIDHLYFK